jgi:hypothetical protein
MKLALCLALASAVFAGAISQADDSMSRTTPTKHQMMKECIEKQKTADVTMSKAAMDRFCKDEVKRRLAGDAPPPPTDPARP